MDLRESRVAPAYFCVGLLFLAVLLIWPVAEIGVMDDWSYIFTARELARTGHIYYNGWATAMLGWPLYVAAAAIRVVGFSFTTVRLTTVAEALVCVYLLQRTFVRAGIAAWNATLGAMTVAFCPIFMMAATSFMSDLAGLLAVVVCLYSCVRALQAVSERESLGWVAVAAYSNALLGTSRQIAWLGVFLLVPSTLLLLRRKRRITVDLAFWASAVVMVFLFLRWYNHQPYSVPESLHKGQISLGVLGHLGQVCIAFCVDAGVFLLPVLAGCLPAVTRLRGRARWLAGGAAALVTTFVLRLMVHHRTGLYFAPALRFAVIKQPSVEQLFAAIASPVKGLPPRLPVPLVQGVVSLCAAAGLLLALAAALVPASDSQKEASSGLLRRHEVLWLALPFLVGYFLLLTPRAMFADLFDRYLLLMLPCMLLLLLTLYQRRFGNRPAALSIVVLGLVGTFTVLSTHDFYALYRATAHAAQEIEASGVPRTAIDGGLEYNRWTELLATGSVVMDGMRLPDGSHYKVETPYPPMEHCSMEAGPQTPHVFPRYSLAYPDAYCVGQSQFAPVSFTAWWPPHQRTIEVVMAGQVPKD